MPRPLSIRADLLLAAALAALGLLASASRQGLFERAPSRVGSATPGGEIASLRDRLHGRGGRSGVTGRSLGRGAETPGEIPARGWWQVAKRAATQTSEHRVMTEAAAVTFYALLAIFPALAALVSIYGLVADPKTVGEHIGAMNGVLPGGGLQIIGEELKRITSAGGGSLSFGAVIGIGVALWSANGGTKSMFDALNVVYDEKEKRGYVRRTLVSLAVTIGILLFVVVAMSAVVALPVALQYVGLGGMTDVLLRVTRWPVLFVVVTCLLAVLYRFGPSREEARWRWVTWGGGIAAIAWIVFSGVFSWYVSSFGSYNKTYGALGAAIGFMTWIWISSIVVLVGAEINAELEHQTAKDTTTGPSRPMGMRGATKADEVAA